MTTTAVPATFDEYRALHNLHADHPTLENHRVLWQLEHRVEDEAPTVIPPCPSWCTKPVGHGYPSYDGALDGQPISYERQHQGFQGEHVFVCAMERNTAGAVVVDEPAGRLDLKGGEMTAEQLRAFAAELLTAAAEVERVTARTRVCPHSAPHGPHDWPSMVAGEDWHCPGVGQQ